MSKIHLENILMRTIAILNLNIKLMTHTYREVVFQNIFYYVTVYKWLNVSSW